METTFTESECFLNAIRCKLKFPSSPDVLSAGIRGYGFTYKPETTAGEIAGKIIMCYMSNQPFKL